MHARKVKKKRARQGNRYIHILHLTFATFFRRRLYDFFFLWIYISLKLSFSTAKFQTLKSLLCFPPPPIREYMIFS